MPCRPLFAIAVALACASLADAPRAALARRHASEPGTGLAAIKYLQPPPDFTFPTAAWPRTLAALFGRPVVMNFWASWCEPCRAEMPAFAALRRTYGDAVSLVAISQDATPGAAAAYLRAHGVDAISVDDPDRKIFALYTIVPIPVTLVLAPDGVVSHVSIGALDWAELHAAVDAVAPANLTLPHAFATVGRNAGTPGQ